MKINITKSNSKLGDQIPQMNMPPILTCRPDAPCKALCYACKGNYRYPNVQQSQRDNMNAYKEDSDAFFEYIIDYLNNGMTIYKYFRWHATGDIIDAKYFEGMIKVAQASPVTRFLAFTKKYDIINDYVKAGGVIPDNLHIVFSAWCKGWIVPNPYKFPVTYVHFKDSTLDAKIPADAIPCTGNCAKCLGCWHLAKGASVVFDQH